MKELAHRCKGRMAYGFERDKNDDERGRWGRDRNVGELVGKFMQPAPMFFTADMNPLHLVDQYRGRSCFLIGGGPSFKEYDHTKLKAPGVVTMSMNNSVKTFRPDLWCCVDNPQSFIRSIWLDPKIMKFVPICHANKKLFNSDKWEQMPDKVWDCPNMVYYRRNEKFVANRFLWEETICWGNHSKWGGGRTVMLAAIRILYLLGFRRVYLVGVDFNMDKQGYHFDQGRHKGSIRGNHKTYKLMNKRLKELRPIFESEDYLIYNCYKDSGLKAFDYKPFDECLQEIQQKDMDGIDYTNERTENLYDREKLVKDGKDLTKPFKDY